MPWEMNHASVREGGRRRQGVVSPPTARRRRAPCAHHRRPTGTAAAARPRHRRAPAPRMPGLRMDGKDGMGTECVERGTGGGGGQGGCRAATPLSLQALLLADLAICEGLGCPGPPDEAARTRRGGCRGLGASNPPPDTAIGAHRSCSGPRPPRARTPTRRWRRKPRPALLPWRCCSGARNDRGIGCSGRWQIKEGAAGSCW